jgi:hypothetical protein
MPDYEYLPGHAYSRKHGCICNPRLNGYGAGVCDPPDGKRRFFTSERCPLHARPKSTPPETLSDRIETQLRQRGFALVEIERLHRLAAMLDVPIVEDANELVDDCALKARQMDAQLTSVTETVG